MNEFFNNFFLMLNFDPNKFSKAQKIINISTKNFQFASVLKIKHLKNN